MSQSGRIRIVGVGEMDRFLIKYRTYCTTTLSDDYLLPRLRLRHHPNPEHIVNKYHAIPEFCDFMDRLDPFTAGTLFDSDLLENRCLPAIFTEFRRWLEDRLLLDVWCDGVNRVGSGWNFETRQRQLNSWFNDVGQHIMKPHEVWETLIPRSALQEESVRVIDARVIDAGR